MNLADVNVGGQLKVGSGVVPAVGEGNKRINGSVYAEGPVQLGDQGGFGSNQATLMVSRTTNTDNDCAETSRSVYVNGNQFINGDSGTRNALYVTGGSGPNSVYIDGDLYVTGATDTGNKGRLASRFATADAKPKPFDLVHPTKGQGHRLRYACIEGPEVGVYYRGRLKNDTEIVLPNYWKDLVHTDSITVQLQPIGAHQDIIVKRWDEEKIYLQAKPGFPINCFYHVYAERKDINPLIVEYQGDSWEDYPDPNFNPEKVDEDKRTYTDPRFAGPQNTFTG